MLIISSGAEVQIAIIVNQITKGEIFNFLAIEEAQSIKKSAHLISKANQITKSMYVIFKFNN
ncbi:MAG: hypothetical protein LBC61_05235 [Candidatus Peribacteria bacterium]|jgi:hypothetical protein|nr:hypothetical protein [Candidatus Peribacteria bacterium]